LLTESSHPRTDLTDARPVAYAENFHGGGFIQWQMVVISIWCAASDITI